MTLSNATLVNLSANVTETMPLLLLGARGGGPGEDAGERDHARPPASGAVRGDLA
jgi:hypothetical protein